VHVSEETVTPQRARKILSKAYTSDCQRGWPQEPSGADRAE